MTTDQCYTLANNAQFLHKKRAWSFDLLVDSAQAVDDTE